MISTGMYGIDDMLGGGIPDGSRVLYSLDPGVDGQLFMISTLYEALEQKKTCLVIIPHTTVEAFLHEVEHLRGHKIRPEEQGITFLDSSDRERIRRQAGKGGQMVNAWQEQIKKICTEKKIEVLFGYFDVLYEDLGLENGLSLLSSACCTKKSTVIVEHLNLDGDASLDLPEVRRAFDLILAIKASFQPLPHFNYFTILYTSWSTQLRRSVPFQVKSGHIVPYIPKIVVTGPPNSGKSRFVLNATALGVSVDRVGCDGPTVTTAMDFGWLHWQDFDITLYGTPGQPRFDAMLPGVLRNAMGAVLLVDATDREQLPRAKQLFKTIAKLHLPLIVAATKKDIPGVMGEDEIRTGLGIGKDVPVFPISALQKNDVRDVLECLVASITRIIS
ncbi:GTP-binding protein [Methanoregula sp. UBA64]|uniref:GTP-binding protein n=1 Tax=Methanoregula sp. UBA64 TaxID=1915554 RepID=UPI0025E9A2AA|nr:GTP-binding protein [Methanoregula sp. UBA64]